MQIHFNSTNFINVRLTQRAFSVWPVAQPVVGEMEMHSVANLATLQSPLATFFPPLQKAPSDKSLGFAQTLFSFWDSLVLPHERKVLLSQRTHTSFSLSVSLHCSASGGEEQRFQLNTDIMLLL